MGLFSILTKELAIDLGTANTVILHNNQVVVDEPSIIAIDQKTKTVKAVGKKALMMEGRTPPGIITNRPLRDGVIADFQATEMMLREFIKMTGSKGYIIPPALKMVICIPSGITEVEERAVRDSAEQAGAKEVRMIHEPMAAAIGIGIDVLDANGNMIIDIGGGTSEIAVIALGGITTSTSVKIAGDRFNSDIIDYMRKKHNIAIGVATAEQIKINVGSAIEDLENPPELSADIYKTGIYLAGGGSLLRGLDKRIHKKTKLQVHVAEDPLKAVARGTAIALKNFDKFPFLMK